MVTNPRKFVIDFSNHSITGVAGVGFLSRMAWHVDLFRELSGLLSLKRRDAWFPRSSGTAWTG